MKAKKRKPQVGRALTWRIVSLTMALWLLCMVVLTWCVASDMQIQVKQDLQYFVNEPDFQHGPSELGWPGIAECYMIDDLRSPYSWLRLEQLIPFAREQIFANPISYDSWLWGKWDMYFGYEPAIIYYDKNADELIRTGRYITFDYISAENWVQQNIDFLGKSYIALDNVPGGADCFKLVFSDHHPLFEATDIFCPILRLNGWLEANEFHPTQIERGSILNSWEWDHTTEQLAALDSCGEVMWETVLTADAPEGQKTITIYALQLIGYNYGSRPVTVNGKTYDTLADLLDTAMRSERPSEYEKHSLWETIVLESRRHTDNNGERYYFASIVRCFPLQYAVIRLVWVYVLSFAVVALILWRILRKLRRNLTAPLRQMADAAQQGYLIEPISKWEEPAAIEEYFIQSHQTMAENKTEINQLRTALDYAHNAEEKRKTLISNITHELKTPLAIIHSYTECLQDGISPEKREQYLSTILEETQRMDGMVLQMLELSRLEAGRVKLAAEPYSMLELTKAIVEKLDPMMQERNLTVCYGLAQEFTITGDEGRMAQVITNLLSNAQKYTTEGGTIRIQVFLTMSTVCFRVTNTAPHLSDEALEKVWDSFYRVDPSRHTSGTGLGLALVKSIVTLQGGTCMVQNTKMDDGSDGVMFGFEIPLK